MHILQKITLATGFALVGGAGISADYVLQGQNADGPYDTATYIDGLFDRFGNDGGFLGLIFRDSAAIDLAMPEPPTGWEAWYVDDHHMTAVFSDEQMVAANREFAKVEAQVPELDHISGIDEQLWNAYFDDTTTAYTRGDNVILLYVEDDNNTVNQPALRKMMALSEAHFDAIETSQPWRSFNGQMWDEVEGPVTQAENGLRPHELRMFETEMGSITMYLEARASEAALAQFLEDFDLTGLRQLGQAGAELSAEATPRPKGTLDHSLRPQLRPASL
ncbi:MAG: hypothetical protein AAFZ99_15855 [Pseudomonadota bacterium]